MQSPRQRLSCGLLDLVMALAVAAVPAFGVFEGCGAVLGYMMCWAAAAPVAAVGMWILLSPRTSAWAAIGVGVVAVVVALGVAREYGFPPRTADLLVWVILLPGIVQLPIGLWFRSESRRVDGAPREAISRV